MVNWEYAGLLGSLVSKFQSSAIKMQDVNLIRFIPKFRALNLAIPGWSPDGKSYTLTFGCWTWGENSGGGNCFPGAELRLFNIVWEKHVHDLEIRPFRYPNFGFTNLIFSHLFFIKVYLKLIEVNWSWWNLMFRSFNIFIVVHVRVELCCEQ